MTEAKKLKNYLPKVPGRIFLSLRRTGWYFGNDDKLIFPGTELA